MKYSHDAMKAIAARLEPATVEETASHWKRLGVSRQSAWLWRKNNDAPVAARMAVAWYMSERTA